MVFLVCLLPLALYCLYLAWLNGSKRAWLIHGPWDFAWVLFALSGFMLAGGPAILTGFSEYWRSFWLGTFAGKPWSQVMAANRTLTYLLLGAVYLLLVIGASAKTLWRRRLTTVIYNVDVGDFEETLFKVIEGMGLRWMRSGNLICFSRAADPPPEKQDWTDLEDEITQTLQLEMSPTLRYICLQWSTADGWPRQALEHELDRYREKLHARDNPLGFWLLLFATALVLGVFLAMVAYLVLALLGR